ncbi:DNA polymerase III polC-type [Mycoplasmopsis bovigenitalium]|uniref:DNA polymerase III PolC-type n=1 Tax=Mycoplasmopsis bovigenitalium TaxID=2112 RepID=A0A449AA82_9BACT|nr:PolC-type DNA polymerase III [Mycoplasmopsis bovigenitalium]VEU61080.1 DNA polymerase III polC-type [Mycoplasmopsis bovigenitalium]
MDICNKRFKVFCQSINFPIPKDLQQTELIINSIDKKTDLMDIDIIFKDEVSVTSYFALYNAILNEKLYNIKATYTFDLLQYKKNNLVNFISYLMTKNKYIKLQKINWAKELKTVNDFQNEIIFQDQNSFLDLENCVNNLVNDLHEYGFKKIEIKAVLNKVEYAELSFENEEQLKQNQLKFQELLNKHKANKSNPTNTTQKFAPKSNWSQRNYMKCLIAELKNKENKDKVVIQGKIYNYEYSLSKNKHIYLISLTDYNDATNVKWYRDEILDENALQTLKIGSWISVSGSISKSMFNNAEAFIFADSISPISPLVEETIDKSPAEKKRIELHASSKLSTMDGLIDPEDLIKRAEKYGMPAIAISDLDAVQGFPKFYQTAQKSSVKALFGASFSTFSKKPNLFLGKKATGKISDSEVVAFDIETTGLSPRFHELIEYGSHTVKPSSIDSNQVQFLIKPTEKIKPSTTRLTGIGQFGIDSKGLDYRVALSKIYDDLNNKIAIAHNAKFDFNFIKEQFRLNNMEFPNVTVIDTLVLSRLIFPERKKHSLGDLAANLGVNYDTNVAHRADYDAAVLGSIWVELMHQMNIKGIKTFEDLESYEPDIKYKERFAYTVSTLVKNQNGLKKQFAMISNCLTKNFNYGPKTYFEDLKSDPDILLGSGSLRSKLLDNYFYSTRESFIEEIQRYDYIEIPAPQCLEHWIKNDFITREQLEFALTDIIETSIEYGKIPVAISDAKYLDNHQKKVYEILVSAKGIGGTRHYLHKFDKLRDQWDSIPNLTLLTTDQMLEQFSFLKDKKLLEDVVINNTHKIANMCEDVEVIKKDLYTPNFDDSSTKLKDLVYNNAKLKYGDNLPKYIENRIEAELTPIIKYGFDVIYWISHKLVKKSLDEGYVVGSRGSVGSSLVATLSSISEVNPLDPHYLCNKCKKFELANIDGVKSCYDLPSKKCENCDIEMDRDGHSIAFETFLGFNADKVPDIDLNFSGEFQSVVHNEAKKIFGDTHTFRAGTILTVKPKTGYGYVKSFCEETKTEYSTNFMDYLSRQLDGVKRTTGQHAGGVIIIPKEYDVLDFTPINYPADDTDSTWFTTHFEYKAIHDNVLKLDLLGHDNPTIIKMLEQYTGIKISELPKNDADVIKIFSSTEPMGIKPSDIGGETTGAIGLPEFGTSFVRQMLQQTQPKTFQDLVSVSGLSHGTDVWLQNNQDLIMDHGLTLPEIFSCRDDILSKLVEQGVPNKFAFDIMEKVRKGKGVSKQEEEELIKYNVKDWQIESMKKIKYMFPKAHAVAYVLMAWWIAWYKIHKPLAFYASYYATHAKAVDIESMVDVQFGNRSANKLVKIQSTPKNELSTKETDLIPTLEITRELYARGLYIDNINLQRSLAHEWLIDEQRKCLIPPFKSLDGLGDAVAESIVYARSIKPFSSIQDFALRGKVNKTLVEKLQDIGAFKELDETDQMRLF